MLQSNIPEDVQGLIKRHYTERDFVFDSEPLSYQVKFDWDWVSNPSDEMFLVQGFYGLIIFPNMSYISYLGDGSFACLYHRGQKTELYNYID